MDTKLNKNIIRGNARAIIVSTTGAWYRLGYAEKKSNFYGEFVLTHNWNNNVPIYCKLLVAGGCTTTPSFYIKEVMQTYHGCGAGVAYEKNKMIKKARVVAYPAGTDAYNIYVDVFIQDTSGYVQKSNNWIYALSTQLNPFALNPYTAKWVDCAFGDAPIPSGFVAQEFTLA